MTSKTTERRCSRKKISHYSAVGCESASALLIKQSQPRCRRDSPSSKKPLLIVEASLIMPLTIKKRSYSINYLYKKPTNPQTFLHYDSCHMETSAKSETGTDFSWHWASNEPLNSFFIFNMSLLTILAALAR